MPGGQCDAVVAETERVFARLEITAVETRTVDALDDGLARIEGLESGDQLRDVLATFYPDLRPDDAVRVLWFTCH